MADTTGPSVPKNAGPKPRLSLLSSKQSCSRLRSEDYPADHANLETSLSGDTRSQSNGFATKGNTVEQSSIIIDDCRSLSATKPKLTMSDGGDARDPNSVKKEQPVLPSSGPSEQPSDGADKLSVSKEDLLALLSMLKSENQSKDIALASIKLEQLKRLINPVEISRSALARTYMQLQDQLKAKDQLKHGQLTKNLSYQRQTSITSSSASGDTRDEKRLSDLNKHQVSSSDHSATNDGSEQESIDILNALLELLDRHPLLALPRDSIYCLDYNCNELSTKNYLNLKIQHLENLIDQHRRFRYHIVERLKQSERRFMDLTLKLEYERNLRLEKEKSIYRNSGKNVLIKHIDELNDALQKEKASKQAIVMTLLNELLDERERNENLSNRVIDLEKRLADSSSRSQQQTSPTTSQQQSACKPRVPAKPAQLLDRQRSQSKNK